MLLVLNGGLGLDQTVAIFRLEIDTIIANILVIFYY